MTRARLAAGLLVAGTAFALLPAAPASAYCDPVLMRLGFGCTNLCEIVNPGGPCPD